MRSMSKVFILLVVGFAIGALAARNRGPEASLANAQTGPLAGVSESLAGGGIVPIADADSGACVACCLARFLAARGRASWLGGRGFE